MTATGGILDGLGGGMVLVVFFLVVVLGLEAWGSLSLRGSLGFGMSGARVSARYWSAPGGVRQDRYAPSTMHITTEKPKLPQNKTKTDKRGRWVAGDRWGWPPCNGRATGGAKGGVGSIGRNSHLSTRGRYLRSKAVSSRGEGWGKGGKSGVK